MLDRKFIKIFFIAALCISIILIIGCGNQGGNKTSSEYSVEDLDLELVNANNQFGIKLYQELLKQEQGNNMLISPASIAMALAMTYNGADDTTQAAMAEALNVQDLSLQQLNEAHRILKDLLVHADPDVQLSIANSLWAREGIHFKEDFIQQNIDYYDAEVTVLDFNDPAAVDTINNWVERSTEGKIEEIVEAPIDPDTILFLINAIYFLGDWTSSFEASDTQDREFTLADNTKIEHPQMTQNAEFAYMQTDQFQAIRLPYGKDKNVGMTLFLPDESSSLEEFHGQLSIENWQQWSMMFRTTEGQISMPRFQLEYEQSLNAALKSLGMEIAFDQQQANFGKMTTIPPNVYIHEVKHKTFIDVNEKGTEAAAVTSVEIRALGAMERFEVDINRPFFLVIEDYTTQSILFMGAINDPT